MGILIGMDEAGYGPNLGPLVVAASAWEVSVEDRGAKGEGSPRGHRGKRLGRHAVVGFEGTGPTVVASALRTAVGEVDLYERLGDVVSRAPVADRLAIADSKALYRPGLGLSSLERGVHAALAAVGRPAAALVDPRRDAVGRPARLAAPIAVACRLRLPSCRSTRRPTSWIP